MLNAAAPDLTGATLTLEIAVPGSAPVLSAAVTVSGPAGAQLLTVADLPGPTTRALDPSAAYRFAVWRDADPHRWPVVEGPVIGRTLA